MTVRPLRYLGDPVLRTRCEPVTRFDDSLARLVADLLETVREPGRAGLAANQIGSTLAVFAFNVDEHIGYLINPVILEVSGDAEGLEACLSVPGVTAVRRRAVRAVATGVDLRQEPVTVAGDDELARCLQHETDHLRGELFLDQLDADERRRVMRQVRRQWPPPSAGRPALGADRRVTSDLAPGG
jgi:peptide deformylase